MQELISKEAVLKLARQLETHLVWYTPTELEPKEFIKKIDSLPTTVSHEYKVGEEYEFSNTWKDWIKTKLHWYRYETASLNWKFIRPLSAEHPDITQARELASKHWMILIPKE